MKRFACSRCGRRSTTAEGVSQHIDAKHDGDGIVVFRGSEDDEEESFADRAIQAQLDVAMGLPTDDDWLLP